MASIRTAIELQDNFTRVLYSVVESVNLGLSAMTDLQQTMSAPVDTKAMEKATASIEAARASINQATIAAQQLSHTKIDLADQKVEIPVIWQSPDFEVFTNSGIERFKQEIQSANNMLNTLNSTQQQIAATAAYTDIFPNSAISDMVNMQNRLQAIAQRIQAIKSNPLNIGSASANAELEQLRGQLNQAVHEQQNLNAAVENMDVEAANQAYLRLSQTVSGTERYIRDNAGEQVQFNRKIESGTQEANKLMSAVKKAAAAYISIQSIGKVIELSDNITQTTARLNLIVEDGGSVEELQDKIFASAQASRGSYMSTADAVSKLALNAGDAFNSNDEIIAFSEQLNKQFIIAGTETAGIEAATLQLTQAMGSGVLRGEELNSVFEQAPTIIQAIADYMEVPIGQIRDMASEGQITADIVKNAMFAAADETNARFESMPMTFSQIWTSFQNNALMAFQPVLQRMNELANSERFQETINGLVEALAKLAEFALNVVDMLVSAAGNIADHWISIWPVIQFVGAAFLAVAAAILVYKAATAIATIAQNVMNGALLACPLTWIIILIIAIVGLIFAIVNAVNKATGSSISALGIITGALATAGAFVWDLFLGLFDLVLGIINYWVNPILAFVNFFGNVFNDPIGSIIHLFGDLADNVLGVIQKIASALDFVFGSNMADTVQGWRDGLSDMVDTAAKEYGNGQYAEIVSALDLSVDSLGLERIAYSDAWAAGYEFGENIENSFSEGDVLSSAKEQANNFLGGIGSGVDDINENTDSMADRLSVTEEDLKYLRDIAEQETVNRFTTAEITIEQTNRIENAMDLDGVVDGLTGAVNEAVYIIAEGVHA